MIKWLIDLKKVEYYYIFASTENINNMKDLVKEEKQTCIILYLEFRLKRRLDTSFTWSTIISILITKLLAIKGNKKYYSL